MAWGGSSGAGPCPQGRDHWQCAGGSTLAPVWTLATLVSGLQVAGPACQCLLLKTTFRLLLLADKVRPLCSLASASGYHHINSAAYFKLTLAFDTFNSQVHFKQHFKSKSKKMSQNYNKRFKPNTSADHHSHQHQQQHFQEVRFKRAHESDDDNSAGSKRRYQDNHRSWPTASSSGNQHQQPPVPRPQFYQPQATPKQNEVENLLKEW